jgi:hypothetical protein
MICPNCYNHPERHELDRLGESFYCPHVAGGTWVIRSRDGASWLVKQNINPGLYRHLTQLAAAGAAALALRSVGITGTDGGTTLQSPAPSEKMETRQDDKPEAGNPAQPDPPPQS